MKAVFIFAMVSLIAGTLGAPNQDSKESPEMSKIFIDDIRPSEERIEYEDTALAKAQPEKETEEEEEEILNNVDSCIERQVCWNENFEKESNAEKGIEDILANVVFKGTEEKENIKETSIEFRKVGREDDDVESDGVGGSEASPKDFNKKHLISIPADGHWARLVTNSNETLPNNDDKENDGGLQKPESDVSLSWPSVEEEGDIKREVCWPEDFEIESKEEKELEDTLANVDLEDLQRELEMALGQSNKEYEKPNVVCLLRSLGAYFKCVRNHTDHHGVAGGRKTLYICALKNWRKFGRCFHH